MKPADGADRRTEAGPKAGSAEDSDRAGGTIPWAGALDGGPSKSGSGKKEPPIATLPEFERGLAEQGLMDADAVRAFVEGLAPEKRPGDAESLARALVRDGKLSRYQASAILQRKAKVLAIGPYVILDKVGSGGMGMVFKARNRDFVDILALKVLPPSSSKKDESVQRFRREARLLARLQHPNLVTSHDIGEYNGVHFLVMDYVEGTDLQQVVRSSGPMRPSRAVDLMIQAARGLGAAHEQGIVHRDIKPANLMVDARGVVRVLDLGLARMTRSNDVLHSSERDASLTQSGIVMGTVDFLSPEQSKDSKRADHRADIYSLGCTFYYLLTGKVPYHRETVMQRLLAHHQDPVPSLRDVRPEIPPDLDAVSRKMLAKAPEQRYPSMADVIKAFEACRGTRADGRVLLVFNDGKAAAKASEAAPDSNPSPDRPTPPTWPADAKVESQSNTEDDLSGYDLLPPQLSGLWTARDAKPKGYKPPEPPPPLPKEHSSIWQAIVIAVAAAALMAAVLAAGAGSRSRRGKNPPPPPPPPTAPRQE